MQEAFAFGNGFSLVKQRLGSQTGITIYPALRREFQLFGIVSAEHIARLRLILGLVQQRDVTGYDQEWVTKTAIQDGHEFRRDISSIQVSNTEPSQRMAEIEEPAERSGIGGHGVERR